MTRIEMRDIILMLIAIYLIFIAVMVQERNDISREHLELTKQKIERKCVRFDGWDI